MKDARSNVSFRCLCRVLKVSRSSLSRPPVRERTGTVEKAPMIRDEIRQLILQHATFGYRRIWAIMKFKKGFQINQKRVYRILRENKWLCHQRRKNPRPRVQGRKSTCESLNTRWALDVTHFPCGRDGLAHLIAVIDCCNREIVGYEMSIRSRANEAVRALEEACIKRFGTLRPAGATPVIRSDNGLIFQSRRFREACRFYRLGQEFITPYTPEQNGTIERFFRSLKEECTWQNNFTSFNEARSIVSTWINWYNHERPHQSLGYRAPHEFQQPLLVA